MKVFKAAALTTSILAFSSFQASADDVKWIGGAMGRWSDGSNWTGKAPPGEDDWAHFPIGTSCTVDLEGADIKVALLYVGSSDDGNLEESPVVLTGGGKFSTVMGSSSRVYNNRKLVLDGVDAYFTGSQFGIQEGATLQLRNGASIEAASTFAVATNGVFDIGSCSAVGKLTMLDGALLRMREGGSLTLDKGPSIADGTPRFDVTGGRIVSNTGDNQVQANQVAMFAVNTLNGAVELGVCDVNGSYMVLKNYTTASPTSAGAGDDTVVEISNGGSKDFTVSEIPLAPLITRSLLVGEGTSLDLTGVKNAAIYTIFRHLSFGADSTNSFDRFAANDKFDNWLVATETSEVDPTAQFKVGVERAPTSGTTYPLLIGAAGGSELSAAQFELVPGTDVDLTGWDVKCVGPFAYLADGKYTPLTESGAWIGGSSGKWSDPMNWVGGSAASAPIFSGERNTVVTNDSTTKVSVKGLRFRNNCAPFILRGDGIEFNRSIVSLGSSCSLYGVSKYPTVFELPISLSVAGTCTVAADGAGPFAFMGGLDLAGKTLLMRGDVMIGSTATMATLDFAVPVSNARGTALHVLSNGNVTVSAQANEIATAASIFVAKGGTMTYSGGAFVYGTVENVHAVDGLLEIQCPFSGTCGITFLGEGTVKLAQVVAPESGSSVVTLKGGVTLEPGSWATEAVSLAVAENGTASIKVDEAFTLNCALTGGIRSHLRKAGAGVLNFPKACVFPGEFKVVEGTVGVTGDLAAAAEEGFVDVLTAKELTGDISVPDGYKFKLAGNPDGSTTLKIAKKGGLMLIFR